MGDPAGGALKDATHCIDFLDLPAMGDPVGFLKRKARLTQRRDCFPLISVVGLFEYRSRAAQRWD
jgi:hypothetical protein